jgi:hypothetical protein
MRAAAVLTVSLLFNRKETRCLTTAQGEEGGRRGTTTKSCNSDALPSSPYPFSLASAVAAARATTDIPLPCPGLLCNLCSCARCSALALMAEHTHVRLVSSDGFVFVIDARAARVSKTLDNMLSAQSACARLARSRRRVQCSRLLRRVCGGAAGRGHTARGACHVLSLGAALSSAVADTLCRFPQWCWSRCAATSTTG